MQDTTHSEFTKLINTLENREDIDQVWGMLRNRLDYMNSQKITRFRVGDKVKFEGRRGEILQGTIRKLNQKTVSVDVPGTPGWRVSPGILTKV